MQGTFQNEKHGETSNIKIPFNWSILKLYRYSNIFSPGMIFLDFNGTWFWFVHCPWAFQAELVATITGNIHISLFNHILFPEVVVFWILTYAGALNAFKIRRGRGANWGL
jgi:hypothetical protein